MDQPRVFVASSTEALPVAEAIHLKLADKADVHVWSDATFRAGSYLLEELLREARASDFAVIVVSPADLVSSGSAKARLRPRDNVLVEYGLFAGALGRERTLIVRVGDVALPSDLDGVVWLDCPAIDRPAAEVSRVAPVCTQLAEVFRGVGLRERAATQVPRGRFDSPEGNATVPAEIWAEGQAELPSGLDLWLGVVPCTVRGLFPQVIGGGTRPDSMGAWTLKASIGHREERGDPFELHLLAADRVGRSILMLYKSFCEKHNHWPDLYEMLRFHDNESIPGIYQLDRVKVVRQ